MPAAPSCDILGSLRASGAVMRHSEEPACQRHRQATFSRRCVPAEPSSDLTAQSHTLLRSADGSTEQHSRKQCGA